MYTRIYNHKLVKVYTTDDLKNSEIISKLKGRDLAMKRIISFFMKENPSRLKSYNSSLEIYKPLR